MNAPGRQTARIDAVEIKITVAAEDLERAIEIFGLDPAEGKQRVLYFCEAVARGAGDTNDTGPPALPLLNHGLILRLREDADGEADSTVKLRPFDPSCLAGHWRDDRTDGGWEFRVEGDWVGEQHTVAASLVAEQRAGEVTAVAEGTRPLRKLFSDRQEELIRDYVSIPVRLDDLRPLGPVAAVKWKPRPAGLAHAMAAERWEVGELRFLELSLKVEPPAAPQAQRDFIELLEGHGVSTDGVQETKTRAVLEYLSRTAR